MTSSGELIWFFILFIIVLPVLGLYGLVRLTVFIHKWAANSNRSYLYLPLVSTVYIYLFSNVYSFLAYLFFNFFTVGKCSGECGLIYAIFGIVFLGLLVLNLLIQFIIAIVADRKRTKNKIINN